METLNNHNHIHNDIKPQNFLVKFLNCKNDINEIEIVLTDFGLVGSDKKGGTPIFASPECLSDSKRKDETSDVFSLGRVFLFLFLPKRKFLEFLFTPLNKGGKDDIMKLIRMEPIFDLTSKMMRVKDRITVRMIRENLHPLIKMKNLTTTNRIDRIVQVSTSVYTNQYIENLMHLS